MGYDLRRPLKLKIMAYTKRGITTLVFADIMVIQLFDLSIVNPHYWALDVAYGCD